MGSPKRKTGNQADYFQSREKVSHRFCLALCQEVSFALFRHLAVCDRPARVVENCLCPVSHTMSVNRCPTLRGTAVSPAGDVLFCLAALLRPRKGTEVLSKTWTYLQLDLKSGGMFVEGEQWFWNKLFLFCQIQVSPRSV